MLLPPPTLPVFLVQNLSAEKNLRRCLHIFTAKNICPTVVVVIERGGGSGGVVIWVGGRGGGFALLFWSINRGGGDAAADKARRCVESPKILS